jgi:choline dehydrogenase-like flavoprotein
LRGYATSISSGRKFIQPADIFGEDLKNQLDKPALDDWTISGNMMGETIPKKTNYVELDAVKKDKYGMPQLRISVDFDENDMKMLADFFTEYSAMFAAAGFENIKTMDTQRKPGNENHEMGGARMGHDPKTSMLNKWNQLHSCKNVFVTDGACMTSTSTQNPSLTYMALTARAVDYAVGELKKRNL